MINIIKNNSELGISKHRKSGKTKSNRRNLVQLGQDINRIRHKSIKKNKMFSSIKELMEKG